MLKLMKDKKIGQEPVSDAPVMAERTCGNGV